MDTDKLLDSNPIDLTKVAIDWLLAHGPHLIIILGLLMMARALETFFVTRLIRRFATPRLTDAPDEQLLRERTLIRITSNVLNIIIWVVAAMMVLSEVGLNIAPVLTAGGVAAVAVLFGGQSFLRDVIAGVFVVFENQYRVGDVITIDKTTGTVEDISLRKVTIRDGDGAVHHIPHGAVTKTTNLTKGFSRFNMTLRVPYHADIEKVAGVINGVGDEMATDEAFRDDTIKPIRFDGINSFDDSAITVNVTGEYKATKDGGAGNEFRKRIKIAFDRHGIDMPYPQRVVHYISDSAPPKGPSAHE